MSSGGSLVFVLDGTDLTRQSAKDTQLLINEHFGKTLTRTIFHGQHTIGGLLESTDAKLKDELSYLISLDLWQQAASRSRSKQRELLRKAAEVEGMVTIREKDLTRALEKYGALEEDMERRKLHLENERKLSHQKEQNLLVEAGDVSDIDKSIESLQCQIQESQSDIDCYEVELSKLMELGSNEISMLRSTLNECMASENNARTNVQTCLRKHDAAVMELHSAEKQLNNLRSEWNLSTDENNATPSFESSDICHTCGQTIASSNAQNYLRLSVEKQIKSATFHLEQAQQSASVEAKSLDDAQEIANAIAVEVKSSMELLQQAEKTLYLKTDDIRRQLKHAQTLHAKYSAELTSLAKKSKQISEIDLIKSRLHADLNRLDDALATATEQYKSHCFEVERIQENITDLKKEKDLMTTEASFTALLVDVFGSKGVQAFVLRNIVQALQYSSQIYLNELSDESLQLRLEVGPNDSIIKQSAIRDPDGTWRNRPLSSLSGGQWRRCSLSLSLGFTHLASNRGKLRSSLLVLDEPLTHLDSAGRASVGKLLRKMLSPDSGIASSNQGSGLGLSTILVILQDIAAEEIEECFDCIDEVIKYGGESHIVVDEHKDQ